MACCGKGKKNTIQKSIQQIQSFQTQQTRSLPVSLRKQKKTNLMETRRKARAN